MGNKPEVTGEDIVRAQIVGALLEDKRQRDGEVLTVLDTLRRTRKARGGVGAPLAVPAHLKDAAAGQGIIVTDRDLNPNAPPKSREEQNDENSDTARRINDHRE